MMLCQLLKKLYQNCQRTLCNYLHLKNAINDINEIVGRDAKDFMTKDEIRALGFDPENMVNEDFAKLGQKIEETSTAPMSDIEPLELESYNIQRWLDDEIPLNEVDTGSVPVAGPILKELQEVYGLSKQEIKDYLLKSGISGFE